MYLQALDDLLGERTKGKGRAVAVGECGLGTLTSTRLFNALASDSSSIDYDRTHFAAPDVQKKHFRRFPISNYSPPLTLPKGSQLALAKKHHLPLFLHSRAAHADFVAILREEGFAEDGGRASGAKGGVVHSFTGTPKEAKELVSLAFCSIRESNEAL